MGIVQLTEKPYLCTRNLIKHNYMVKRYYILFLVFAFVLQVHAQQDEMRQTVAYLASQELGGRYPGTAGDSLASAYIVDQLRSLKLKPIIKAKKEKGFYQDFNFTKKEQEITTHNILAVLPGKDKQLRNEYIVVGSHYDHLGMGGEGSGSRRPDTLAVHPGADDNASGDAVVLQLAKYFKKVGSPRSIIFAFSNTPLSICTGSMTCWPFIWAVFTACCTASCALIVNLSSVIS